MEIAPTICRKRLTRFGATFSADNAARLFLEYNASPAHRTANRKSVTESGHRTRRGLLADIGATDYTGIEEKFQHELDRWHNAGEISDELYAAALPYGALGGSRPGDAGHDRRGEPEIRVHGSDGPGAGGQEVTPSDRTGRGLARPRAEVSGAPTFFSQLERTIEQKMPAKASPAQVLAIVGNPQNMVKADEVKWTGLREWLAGQKGPVTRQQDGITWRQARLPVVYQFRIPNSIDYLN